jgi:hypothetical protein
VRLKFSKIERVTNENDRRFEVGSSSSRFISPASLVASLISRLLLSDSNAWSTPLSLCRPVPPPYSGCRPPFPLQFVLLLLSIASPFFLLTFIRTHSAAQGSGFLLRHRTGCFSRFSISSLFADRLLRQDGVLKQGQHVLPQAKQVMQILTGVRPPSTTISPLFSSLFPSPFSRLFRRSLCRTTPSRRPTPSSFSPTAVERSRSTGRRSCRRSSASKLARRRSFNHTPSSAPSSPSTATSRFSSLAGTAITAVELLRRSSFFFVLCFQRATHLFSLP